MPPRRSTRFVLIGANGFVAEVAAGSHHREAEGGKEQVMKRGVGKHHAEVGIAGGEGGGQGWGVKRET